MRYDAVIVGGGVSGLASAIILGQEGLQVALVEKSRETAPLIRGFKRRGLNFDTGFHYAGGLGPGGILNTYCRYLGVDAKLTPVAFDPQGFDTVRMDTPAFEFTFAGGIEAFKERLFQTFPHERLAVETFLSTLQSEVENAPHLNLDLPFAVDGISSPWSETSLKSFLDRLIKDDRLKTVLSVHCMLHGSEPSRSSVSHHARIVWMFYQSVHGLLGGGTALADALTERLREVGVNLYLGRGATQILHNNGTVQGVQIEDGEILDACRCVCSTHPRLALDLVGRQAFRPAFVHRIEGLEETLSAYMVFARSHAPIPALQRRNLFLCHQPDFEKGIRPSLPIEERTLFIFASALRAGETGPQGVVVICPAGIDEVKTWGSTKTMRRPKDYQDMKTDIAQRLLSRVEGALGEPKGSLESLDVSTPLTFRDLSHSPFGSLYGVKQCFDQFTPLPRTKIQGLFFTGQALCGPGVLGAMISAAWTCGEILGHDIVRGGLKTCRSNV